MRSQQVPSTLRARTHMMVNTPMQFTKNELVVWFDAAATRKQNALLFEHDETNGPYIAVGQGNNNEPTRLTNISTPVLPRDAVNKQYVDDMIQRSVTKESAPSSVVHSICKLLKQLCVMMCRR